MNSNLTVPKAILLGSLMIALSSLFTAEGRSLFIAEANADVAGMSYSDLRRDRDFKKAVKYIIENCSVTGYVDGDYLHSSDISC